MSTERGTVKVTINGRERTLKAAIKLVPEIEDATGKGLTTLAGEILTQRGRITDVAHVLRIALADAGTNLSFADVLGIIEHDGITQSTITAGLFLGAFYPQRESGPSQKKVAKAAS